MQHRHYEQHRPTVVAAVAAGRAKAFLFGTLVLVAAMVTAAGAMARPAPDGFADLADRLLPSVVNVSTTQTIEARGPELPQFPPGSPFEEFFKEFFERGMPDQPRRRATSLGSGFIIDSSGYIVTNNHVIEDAEEIKVILHDETQLDAELVGRDPKTDLALLKVDAGHDLPAVSWGNSGATRVGDWVVAIGNPFGLGGTVTAGIVSARARDINAGPYDDFLQTDASINRGNSGGPMFNMDGEVIGINTAIFSPSGGSIGIGFAIPSNLAKPVVEQLRNYGETRRGWLGVRIQTVTDEIADSLGLDRPRGALVASVTDGGPAKDAGIEQGDVILEFDGKSVDEMRRLPRIVAETGVDKTVDVVIWRKGERRTVPVTIGRLEEAEAEMAALENGGGAAGESAPTTLGLTLEPLSDESRRLFSIDSEIEGVVVTDVAADSPAAEKQLRAGDVIVEVSQEAVKAPEDVAKLVAAAREAGRKSVLLLVQRADDLRFVAVRVDG